MKKIKKYNPVSVLKGDLFDYVEVYIDLSKESEWSKYLYHRKI
jgi:hypothetical protein